VDVRVKRKRSGGTPPAVAGGRLGPGAFVSDHRLGGRLVVATAIRRGKLVADDVR
jgi:hypothetical protein